VGLLVDAKRQIDLLAYAMLFLPETHPRLFDLLRGKAAAGCQVRIAMVDPASEQVAERDAEEGLNGGLVARVRTSIHFFAEGLADCDGIDLRTYAAPLYNSLLRFDDEMFVTPHLYATTGYRAPCCTCAGSAQAASSTPLPAISREYGRLLGRQRPRREARRALQRPGRTGG
jgi:hypothetical protein